MTLIRRDVSEVRFNSLFLLSKESANYWKDLLKNAKAFFWGMERQDLVDELNNMIEVLIEKPMGSDIDTILNVHKNLPTLNSFTRSRNPLHMGENIYKSTITRWLNEIETYIFKTAMSLEDQINFTLSGKQWV